MKGTRPLDNDEIRRFYNCFEGTFEVRNLGLFMIGVSTGGRISELLDLLRVGDAYQNGQPVTDLLYSKSIVKGREVSRAVPVNRDGRQTIDDLSSWHIDYYGITETDRPLFPSRNGHLATHSLRKSFASLNGPSADTTSPTSAMPTRRPRRLLRSDKKWTTI